MSLHVSPIKNIFGDKGFSYTDDAFIVDSCFWEMFEHARRLVLVVYDLLKQNPSPDSANPDPETDLPDFKLGWRQTQDMQQIFYALLEAAKQSASESS
ncbi:MAG TPA: hypothetical protein VGC87_11700 [Pyrinomonadaceae bacterium]|jgi:hypothetical protein